MITEIDKQAQYKISGKALSAILSHLSEALPIKHIDVMQNIKSVLSNELEPLVLSSESVEDQDESDED